MLRSSVRKRFTGLRPEEAMRMVCIQNRVQRYCFFLNYARMRAILDDYFVSVLSRLSLGHRSVKGGFFLFLLFAYVAKILVPSDICLFVFSSLFPSPTQKFPRKYCRVLQTIRKNERDFEKGYALSLELYSRPLCKHSACYLSLKEVENLYFFKNSAHKLAYIQFLLYLCTGFYDNRTADR